MTTLLNWNPNGGTAGSGNIGIDLSAYATQSGDINTIFTKQSGATGMIVGNSAGTAFLAKTTAGQNSRYLCNTAVPATNVSLRYNGYLAGANDYEYAIACDDGTGNNYLVCGLYQQRLILQIVIGGVNTVLANILLNGGSLAAAIYEWGVDIDDTTHKAKIYFGSTGASTIQGTTSGYDITGLTVLNHKVGLQGGIITTPPVLDGSSQMLVTQMSATYTPVAATAFSASVGAATSKVGGTTGLTVTPNGALAANEVVTITDDLGDALGTLNFASGATAVQTLNITWASGQVGARTITSTPSPALGTAPTASVTVYNLTLTPSNQSDLDGQSVTLTATLTGGSGVLAASVAGGGTLSTTAPTSGTPFQYTAPSTGTGTATITVTGNGGTSATATVAYAPGIIILLDQSSQTINQGATATVNAMVSNTGGSSTAATFTGNATTYCTGSGNQRIFTAPATAGTYTLTATSVADNTKTVSIVFTVSAVAISFASTALCQVSSTVSVTPAVVTGSVNTAVTYTLLDGGTYGSGTFTPPNGTTLGQTFRVVATSVADGTKTSTCTITMTQTFAYPAIISLGVSSLTGVTVQVDGGSGYGTAQALTEELDGTTHTGVYSTTLNLAYTTQYRLRYADGQGNYSADTVYRASPASTSITVGGYATGQDPVTLLKADSDFKALIADTNGAFTFAVPSAYPGAGTLVLKDKAGVNTLATITLAFDQNRNVISRSVA